MKTLIKGGTILLEHQEFVGDIMIEDRIIKAVSNKIKDHADKEIDATGRYILAGGVDEHTHYGSFHSLSFDTCGAATAGGTTTIMDFVPQLSGQSLKESLDWQILNAKDYLYVNIGFHSMLMDLSNSTLQELKLLKSYGISSIKMFMAYKGTPYYAEKPKLKRVMELAAQAGLLVMLHAEDADTIERDTTALLRYHLREPAMHSLAHSPISEVLAVEEAIQLAKQTKASVFFVHISTKQSLTLIENARKKGVNVSCETCTHYLIMSQEALLQPDLSGCRYICSPSLRTIEDQNALWNGIKKGSIEAVSSDHCAISGGLKTKIKNYTDFSKVPNGMPGVQNRLHLLWTYGVCEGKLSRHDLVKIFSVHPAIRCQIKNKGRIEQGYDADIVIYNPYPKRIWRDEDSLEGIDYASYAGYPINGMVEKVWVNGELSVENEVCLGNLPGALLLNR